VVPEQIADQQIGVPSIAPNPQHAHPNTTTTAIGLRLELQKLKNTGKVKPTQPGAAISEQTL